MSSKIKNSKGDKAIEAMWGKGSCKGSNRQVNYKGHNCGCSSKKGKK